MVLVIPWEINGGGLSAIGYDYRTGIYEQTPSTVEEEKWLSTWS
jgi:hypothetical protein